MWFACKEIFQKKFDENKCFIKFIYFDEIYNFVVIFLLEIISGPKFIIDEVLIFFIKFKFCKQSGWKN